MVKVGALPADVLVLLGAPLGGFPPATASLLPTGDPLLRLS
jgi:hypothetical protein